MLSNRTANFKAHEKEEDIKASDKNFLKLYTTPLPKFDMNYHFKDENLKLVASVLKMICYQKMHMIL